MRPAAPRGRAGSPVTERDATSPAVALGRRRVAWSPGSTACRPGTSTAAPLTADGELGAAQALDTEPGGAPRASPSAPAAPRSSPGPPAGGCAPRCGRPAPPASPRRSRCPARTCSGWSAAVTGKGETIVALARRPAGHRPARRRPAAGRPSRRRAGALGAPRSSRGTCSRSTAPPASSRGSRAARPAAYETERRVRFAQLAGAAPAGGGDAGGRGAADRRAPRVKLRVLGVRGRRVRVAVRSDERAALRATWRRGARTVGRRRAARCAPVTPASCACRAPRGRPPRHARDQGHRRRGQRPHRAKRDPLAITGSGTFLAQARCLTPNCVRGAARAPSGRRRARARRARARGAPTRTAAGGSRAGR